MIVSQLRKYILNQMLSITHADGIHERNNLADPLVVWPHRGHGKDL